MCDMSKNGNRYCLICGRKLVRNGHYANGKVRLYCKHCKKSFLSNKLAVKKSQEYYWKQRQAKYLKQNNSIEKCGYERTTFWRHTHNLVYEAPTLFKPIKTEKYIGLDGTWTGIDCYLLANTKTRPIAIQTVCYEKFDTWVSFIKQLPPAEYFVCDGQKGLIKAIKLLYPSAKIQICIWHVYRRVVTKLTQNPQTDAGKELLYIGKFLLTKVRDKDMADLFISWLDDWYQRFESFIKERTYGENKRKWFYTHKNVRSAYRTMRKYLNDKMLLTFLKDKDIPRTNNGLEGGINSQIKRMVYNHRGWSYKTRKNAIMLYLNSRSGLNT